MHLELPHRTYTGPAIDDPEILARLPSELAAALQRTNGAVGWQGGLHVRGASRAPAWHSLRNAWEGPNALHELFEEVGATDVPFAEDAFGDQFLLREGRVLRLAAELGETSEIAGSLDELFERLWADPEAVLDYGPLLRFRERGGELPPGMLLAAYPPFVLGAEGTERDIRPVDAIERRHFLGELARQLHGLPDGATIRLEVTE